MNRDAYIGLRLTLFGTAAFFLLPALLRAQAAPAKPPEKPNVVDMGIFRVSAPPGKNWRIEPDSAENAVYFTKYKEGFMPGSDRVSLISVQCVPVNIYGWRSTEEEVIGDWLRRNLFVERTSEASWEATDWEGKRIRAVVTRGGRGGAKRWSLHLFYFPPDSAKSHRFFVIVFASESGALRFSGDPSQEAVRAVIRSLEIVDRLQAIAGPHGDLVRAAAAGNAEGVVQAIEKGADINAGGPGGGALAEAAYHGRREIVDKLLEKGARVDIPNAVGGATSLLSAIIGREPEIACLLVAKGADVNRKISAGGGSGVSALMFATAIGSLELARAIIDAGAKLEARTALGETALVLAADNGWTEGAALLLERGADPNARMSDGWTALMRAADKKRSDVVKLQIGRAHV